MRPLALVLSIVSAVALTGCADDALAPTAPPTSMPMTALSVFIEPGLERLLPEVEAFVAEQGLELQLVAASDADLVVASEADPGGFEGTAVTIRQWVPVTGPSALVTEISMAAIADLVAGRPTVWSPRPGEEIDVSLIVPDEPRPPLEQWAGRTATGAVAMPLDAIPDALAADPGAVALVPLEAVDARVRGLAVDGFDIVFEGDVDYPLREFVHVEPRIELPRELVHGMALRLAVEEPAPVVLRATGDIIPARCVFAKHEQYGDPAHAFRELGPWLAEAGITVGSLDAAISDAGPPFGCVETFSLLAPASAVEGLALAGFDVITVATNHVKDCGQRISCGDDAFFQTLLNLQSAGIATAGGGADLAQARAPAIVEAGGVRFAFLGYDEIASYYHAADGVPGTAPLLEQYLREDVAAARASADIVVVLPQWGVEYTHDPTASQRALARAAVEAGADLVIGNHPHWVQATEVIDGVFVAYALGNFVFDQDWSVPTQQGVVLDVAFHGTRLAGVRMHPVRIVDAHQPVFAEPAEAAQILDAIVAASARLE